MATLLASFAFAGQPPAHPEGTVRVEVRRIGFASDPPDLRLQLTVAGDESAVVEQVVASDVDTLTLRLPAAGDWTLSCLSSSWCAPTLISWPAPADAAATPVVLEVHPVATVEGRVRTTASRPEPDFLDVQGAIRGEDRRGRYVDFGNVAVEEGRFRLRVPRTTLDLRFAAAPWVPEYVWDVRPGESADLGRLDLEVGGSVSGFVFDTVSGHSAEGATVRLVRPEARPSAMEPELASVPLGPAPARTNALGFFQIGGVPPGRYQLQSSMPERATTRLEPVDVHHDAETHLGEVELVPFLSLDVAVEPALQPSGEPWVIRLRSVETRMLPSLVKSADESGRSRFSALGPGHYTLVVTDGADARLATRTITLSSSSEVSIAVPLVRVSGVVSLGGERLRSDGSVVVETGETDETRFALEDGEFSGFIRRPEQEAVLVTVEAPERALNRRVRVEPKPRGEQLRLEVSLGSERILGYVVDDAGSPVYDAVVRATGGDEVERTRTRSGADGKFAIEGLEATTYQVRAEHPEAGSSEPVGVHLGRSTSPDLRLVLWPRVDLSGSVRNATGAAVPFARVEVMGLGASPAIRVTRADATGRFETAVAEASTHVLLRVSAPTELLWSGCLPARPHLEVVLPPPPGGRLSLAIEGTGAGQGRPVVLTREGGYFELGTLATWGASAPGGFSFGPDDGEAARLVVSAMAPSVYGAFLSEAPWWNVAEQACGLRPVPPDLDWSPLVPTDTVELQVDKGKERRE